MLETGDSQNDKILFRAGTTHPSDKLKPGYKIAVITATTPRTFKKEPGP